MVRRWLDIKARVGCALILVIKHTHYVTRRKAQVMALGMIQLVI